MSAGSAEPSNMRASASTSEGTASSPSRAKSSICGTRFFPTLLERPRMSRIYYDGKFYSYPLRAFEALRNLGIWRSAAAWLSYPLGAPVPGRKDGETSRTGTINQFGERALFDLLQDLHRKGLGNAVRRDVGRLGGPAHQGPEPGRRGPRRPQALARPQQAAERRQEIKTLLETSAIPVAAPA